MVNGSLNDYVRTQLRRGYSPETLRSSLIHAGYLPQDVDFALRLAAREQRNIVFTGRAIAVALISLFAIVLLVFAGFLVFSPGAKDIQIAMRVEQPLLAQGDALQFSTILTSEQAREVPVSLDYVVTDPVTRRTITSRSERIRVGASAVSSKNIPLPETLPIGDYEIKLTARFEGLTRIQTSRFTIQTPAAQPEKEAALPQPATVLAPEELECPPTCDDLNPATEDFCERGSCIHRIKEGVCGNSECEGGENRFTCPEDCGPAQDRDVATQEAIRLATNDPEKAATLCTSLVVPEAADPCFAAIANASKRSQLCANIHDDRRRDGCLMEFALSNDFTVCPQLANRYFLTSCYSLARLAAAPQEQAVAEQRAREIEQQVASDQEEIGAPA